MAQCTGGTTFDYAAQHKHDAAQSVLSRAADIWATSGREALSPDSVIAVLLGIFRATWSDHGGVRQETRSLEKWLPLVGTAREEAEAFAPHFPSATAVNILSVLLAEISSAADQWSLGDPEQPPTAHALNAIEHIVFMHKLAHRPANPKLPVTIRNPHAA